MCCFYGVQRKKSERNCFLSLLHRRMCMHLCIIRTRLRSREQISSRPAPFPRAKDMSYGFPQSAHEKTTTCPDLIERQVKKKCVPKKLAISIFWRSRCSSIRMRQDVAYGSLQESQPPAVTLRRSPTRGGLSIRNATLGLLALVGYCLSNEGNSGLGR